MAPTELPLPSKNPARPVAAITRQHSPANIEFPFDAFDGLITPNSRFYIRIHFPTPSIDPRTWVLRIEGHVEHPVDFTLDELLAMPQKEQIVTLECAGNGRVFLEPQVEGAQWELGAVSTARWTGVPLTSLLAKAGIKPGAVEAMFEGADHGHPKEKPTPPDEIHYAHSIPMHKAPDVLMALQMNDQPLPPSHGYPLRAIVGGWYGMASVKWVSRIIVLDQAFRGYFRTVDYAYWTELAGQPVRVPIEELRCKSQIARPAKGEIIPRDTDYTVIGAAWTGDTDVVRVEVSTDNGQTFSDATLLGRNVPHAWRPWKFDWHSPAQPGLLTLFARATDARGRVQPLRRNPAHGTYMIDHMLPVECQVQ